LGEISLEEIETLLAQIRSIHSDIIMSENGICNEFGHHPLLGSQILRTDIGEPGMKHITQTASILSIVARKNMFQDSTCFIEFGSGKGGLTYWIGQVNKTEKRENCRYYPLDRKSHRNKKDNKLKS